MPGASASNGSATRTKKASATKVNTNNSHDSSGHESQTRASERLALKKKNKKMLPVEEEREQESEGSDRDEEEGSLNSTARQSSDEQSTGGSGASAEESGSEDGEVRDALEGSREEQTAKDLMQIERETRDRIDTLKKRLAAEKKAKAKAEAAKSRKLAKVEALRSENAKRASLIEELQRQEDELFSQVKKLKSKPKSSVRRKSSHPPSAHSTPRTTGEYNNIIRGLLNMSFTEHDLLSSEGARRLAPSKVREIQSMLENTVVDKKGPVSVGVKRKEHDVSSSEVDEDQDESPAKKGKLKSGKCAKIDSTDIKKVVSYPHTRLNREFVRVSTFDELPLNIFAAGEIEIILRTKNEAEKLARLNILLMCLYHSQFLDISEIRDQYDVLMKSVERGEYFWVDNLGEKIDRALDRRTRLVDREVKAKSKGLMTTKPVKKVDKQQNRKDSEFIYCLEFNKGTCPEVGTHIGRFAGKDNVFKNHVCRKCWSEKAVKVGHAEIDDRCPLKTK